MTRCCGKAWLRNLVGAWLIGATLPAPAQVAPDAADLARYVGLHAAAAQGSVAALQRHASADVNAQDSRGRTPLHVATFLRQREAIRWLAGQGADLGALEGDRYDAVTIAAVADD